MSFNYSPKVVTNGLVLSLDAANQRSYPGSGTSWYDLTGNFNNGTLVNGPTFSSANGGSIVFDGVDDYANTNYTPPTSSFTVSIVYKCTNFSTWAGVWACEVWNSGTGYLAYFPTSTTLVFTRGGQEPAGITANSAQLNYYTFSVSSEGYKTYVNGVLSNTNTSTTLASSVTKPILLSTRYNNTGTGTQDLRASVIPYFSIYNRALSATEILQNYNALKTRFGL